jgi:hypothetical protein
MELATLDSLTKVCRRCGVDKLLSTFSKDGAKKDGLKLYCKPCEQNQFKLWREKNLEEILLKDRIKHYVRKYGLSQEKAMELVKDRSGSCEICKETGKKQGYPHDLECHEIWDYDAETAEESKPDPIETLKAIG